MPAGQRAHPFGAEPRLAGAAPAEHSQVVHGPPLLAQAGGSWCAMREGREVMVEPHPSRSGSSVVTNCLVSPACDKSVNASRKFVTEFIDVCWHVIV